MDKLLKLQKTQDEVDFVVKQLLSKMEGKCKCVNQIPLAKEFNLPYDSQIALLLTLLLENK